MAYTDYQHPFDFGHVHDVLRSAREIGVVHRRRRFPRPLAQRIFTLHYDTIHQADDVAVIVAAIDASKGACLTFNVTLPVVGAVVVRFDDDGYRYVVHRGKWREMVLNLVEEVRVPVG